MKRIYKIEASIDKLVAERVRQTGEPEGKVVAVLSNDPVAIASVAVDARAADELATELSEFRFEVKAGLSNLDKKMQQMLDGKQGDREEIAKVLAAVKAGVSRDEKLLAAVEAGARATRSCWPPSRPARRATKSSRPPCSATVRSSTTSARRVVAAQERGMQRDESLKKRIAQGPRKSKKDFVRQTKDNQLEQFEVEPDYVEDKPFARGGEGEVAGDQDTVVLKKMSLVGVTATKRQKMLNSFKGELAIMVRLRSPRVAQFYGVVTTDSTFLGLVMEYCPGVAARRPQHRRRDHVDRRRIWVSDVALGMSYLYSQGVEHRDLKALNVLLTHDLRCKVTDFGLSKCEDLKTTATATMGGAGLAGTPAFMAPELLGQQHVYGKERRLLVRHRAVGNLGPRCAVARAEAGADHATGRRQAPTPASAAGDAGPPGS